MMLFQEHSIRQCNKKMTPEDWGLFLFSDKKVKGFDSKNILEKTVKKM